jgi:transposase
MLHSVSWTPDLVEIRESRALVRRLETLMDMRQQEVNRLLLAPPVVVDAVRAHVELVPQSSPRPSGEAGTQV